MRFKCVVIVLVPCTLLCFYFVQISWTPSGPSCTIEEEEKPDQRAGQPSSPETETWKDWMDAQTPQHENLLARLAEWHGGDVAEGHMLLEQANYFSMAARHLLALRQVCEIGCRHVALEQLLEKTLQEFDLGEHQYVFRAKEFVDQYFPGRLNLTLGDSAVTVPEFVRHNRGFVCDLVHVDGNHIGEMPLTDLMNMRALARPHSLLFIDDVVCTPEHCQAPQKAWDKLKRDGVVEEWDCWSVNSSTRRWCAGRYLF